MTGKLHILPRWVLGLILLAGTIICPAQQQTNSPVSASVQPAQVTVGDSVTYQVSISVTGAGQPSVAVPVINPDTGLSTPTPSGTQTSFESYMVNGQFRSVQRITYTYSIRATKEGRFVIPPATVTLGSKTYDTEPVEVLVQPAPEAKDLPDELKGMVVAPIVQGDPEMQRKLTGVIFVLPVLSSTTPYNGEQVRISYHLVIDPEALSQAGILPRTNLDGVNVPAMTEFIKEELYPFPQELKFQERKIGGRLYLVAPVYEAVITSTKTGKLNIEPFQISMIFSQNGRRRGRSPFADDPLLSQMGPLAIMGGSGMNVIAQSPTLSLDVKPIPEAGRPADYAGAVGDFKLTAEVDKKHARTYDDTIKLDITLQGEGNAESLSAPKLPDLPGFTVLGKPEEETSGRKEDKNYISVKKFSYTLRPTIPGKHTIPAITMSSFEPKKEQFTRVETSPIDIQVSPGTHPAPTPAPSSTETETDNPDEPVIDNDYRYIYTGSPVNENVLEELFRGASAYAMFLIPFGILGAAAASSAVRRYKAKHQLDPRKLASASSSNHFKQAHKALGSGNTTGMFGELADAIRLYFASRFNITAAEATIPEIEERLARNGAPVELISQISGLLETCDSARYAPTSNASDAAAILKQAERAVKEADSFT